jgi:hypothetical protein
MFTYLHPGPIALAACKSFSNSNYNWIRVHRVGERTWVGKYRISANGTGNGEDTGYDNDSPNQCDVQN